MSSKISGPGRGKVQRQCGIAPCAAKRAQENNSFDFSIQKGFESYPLLLA